MWQTVGIDLVLRVGTRIGQENGASEVKIHATKPPKRIAKSCKVGFESTFKIFILSNSGAIYLVYQIYITD